MKTWKLTEQKNQFVIDTNENLSDVIIPRSHSTNEAQDRDIKNSSLGHRELMNAKLMASAPELLTALLDEAYANQYTGSEVSELTLSILSRFELVDSAGRIVMKDL